MVKSVLLAVVFQSLSVAVHSFVISYNTPQQCGDVEISWTKPSTSAAQLQFPLLLHILPFDSDAISQEIPGWNASMTSGSSVVDFSLNLTCGTGFLLAVTDQIGTGVGHVSDVKNVSSSQDRSCLFTNTTSSPSHFQTFTTPSSLDCPSLNVTWDELVKSSHPTILGFSPGQSPVNMDPPSASLPTERSVLIEGAFTSLSRVIVLFRDDASSGPSRTSQFLTVGGLDKDGCSPSASNSELSIPPCDLQCSNKSAGRVIGGVLAAFSGFSILLYVVFAYFKQHHWTADEPASGPEEVSSVRPQALPPPLSGASFSDDPHLGYPSTTLTTTKFEGLSDEPEQQHGLEQEKDNCTATTLSSIGLTNSAPLPVPASPLTKRRCWTPRSTPSMSSEVSILLLFTEASMVRPSQPNEAGSGVSLTMHDESGPVSRPDSPTLPESKSRHTSTRTLAIVTAVAPAVTPTSTPTSRTPRTPRTPRPRSQRSERREDYLKLDPASEITVSAGGGVYNLRSVPNRMSRTSRTSLKSE